MPQSAESQAVMKRYADAYLVARVTNGWGEVVKGIGVAIALLLTLVGVTFLLKGREDTFAFGVLTIFFGVISGVGFYVGGILFSAQGQMLKASLDSAVNSSPFLTNKERALIMSLPTSPKSLSTFSAEESERGFSLEFDGDEVKASFAQPLDYLLGPVVEATQRIIQEAFKDSADSPTYVQWVHEGRSVKAIKLNGRNYDYVSVVQVGAGKVLSTVVSKIEKGSLD